MLDQRAMGEVEADLIVTNGKVVNVYSGEILEGIEMVDRRHRSGKIAFGFLQGWGTRMGAGGTDH
jgi:adenine deaminase